MNQGEIKTKIKCVKCNANLDGFTSLDDDSKPSDGDLSICFYCGSVGTYAENLTMMKPLSKTELEKIEKEDPKLFMQMKKVIDGIKTFKKSDI
jgi:hypothetical protein